MNGEAELPAERPTRFQFIPIKTMCAQQPADQPYSLRVWWGERQTDVRLSHRDIQILGNKWIGVLQRARLENKTLCPSLFYANAELIGPGHFDVVVKEKDATKLALTTVFAGGGGALAADEILTKALLFDMLAIMRAKSAEN
jgi:hypothetical protein